MNSAYSNWSRFQISTLGNNLTFFDQICSRTEYFWSKMEEMNIFIESFISDTLSTRFWLKLIVLSIGPNLSKKLFLVQNRKSELLYWILNIRNSLGMKFQLKLIFVIFWTKFDQKWLLPVSNKEVNITLILYIQSNLSTKFQLKLTILIFRTKFTRIVYFWSKTEKENTTNEFSTLELV